MSTRGKHICILYHDHDMVIEKCLYIKRAFFDVINCDYNFITTNEINPAKNILGFD